MGLVLILVALFIRLERDMLPLLFTTLSWMTRLFFLSGEFVKPEFMDSQSPLELQSGSVGWVTLEQI